MEKLVQASFAVVWDVLKEVVTERCSDGNVDKLKDKVKAEADSIDSQITMSEQTPLLPIFKKFVARMDQDYVCVDYFKS